MDDPTAWIENHPLTHDEQMIRIGLAHGSLNIMRLPEDDHLIRPDAAIHYGLDYLALGHWHSRSVHKSSDGIERTAYSGTHEPMSFRGANAGLATGWSSFSADGDATRFQNDGHGIALLVTIDAPKAPPRIESIEVGRLRWTAEEQQLTGQPISSLIKEYSGRDNPELTVLRLTLGGIIDPRGYARLGELRQIVENRYHAGSRLDADGVLIEPSTEQLAEAVGVGVLKRVLDRLKDDIQSTDAATRKVTEHALKLLYQIAWEEQPA